MFGSGQSTVRRRTCVLLVPEGDPRIGQCCFNGLIADRYQGNAESRQSSKAKYSPGN